MPRQPRIDVQGQLYHVIARGIERANIFLKADDYGDFIARLETALKKTDGKCMAWCLIPNHFHLLILRGSRPLSELMRRVMTGYAVNFNSKHRRSGHLFQNRYKAILCDAEEYLLELVAYIHLNPLRAGLVGDMAGLEKYKWCGHGALTGMQKAGFLEREYILSHFNQNEKAAVLKYAAFIRDRQGRYKGKEYSGGGIGKKPGGAGECY
jgi:REP element-mobilizing transposase RayT